MKLYLGYDGPYVLSKRPLQKAKSESGYFLCTGKQNSMIDMGENARILFGHLKMRKYEVAELHIRVLRTKRKPKPKKKRG